MTRIDFTKPTKNKLQEQYHHRCGVCLRSLECKGRGDCAHIIDSSDKKGDPMQDWGTENGLLSPKFTRRDISNGIFLCSDCHKLFTHGCVAIAPSSNVLKEILELLEDDEGETCWEYLRSRPDKCFYHIIPLGDEKRCEIDFHCPTSKNEISKRTVIDVQTAFGVKLSPYTLDLKRRSDLFWRLPLVNPGAILTAFLFRISNVASRTESVELGHKIRAKLDKKYSKKRTARSPSVRREIHHNGLSCNKSPGRPPPQPDRIGRHSIYPAPYPSDNDTSSDYSNDEGSSDEDLSDEDFSDGDFSAEDVTDGDLSEEDLSDEDLSDAGSSNQGSSEEDSRDEGSSDEGSSDEGSSDEGSSDEGSSDEDSRHEYAANEYTKRSSQSVRFGRHTINPAFDVGHERPRGKHTARALRSTTSGRAPQSQSVHLGGHTIQVGSLSYTSNESVTRNRGPRNPSRSSNVPLGNHIIYSSFVTNDDERNLNKLMAQARHYGRNYRCRN
ncbi:hypothetical protein DL96DRAFT_1810533 [Flagelloscypha sp. PMI_526]|nr:hypothetical protein DL96DRAFT_1810533 [Flagelloscypha sp. PMI_526]